MRRALFIVVLLLFAPMPTIGAETETIHLWSEGLPELSYYGMNPEI